MRHSNQEAINHVFRSGLMALALFTGPELRQMVWAADPTDSSPPTSPAPPPPVEEETPDASRGKMREGMQKFRQACEADVKQFCPNVKAGGGRIVQCLEDHAKQVSASCSQILQKREQRRQK